MGDEAAALQDRPLPLRRRLPRVHARPTTCSTTSTSTCSPTTRRGSCAPGSRTAHACPSGARAARRVARRHPSHGPAVHRGHQPGARPWRGRRSCGTAATRTPSTCSARRRSRSRDADAYAERVRAMLDALGARALRRGPHARVLEQDPWGDVPRINVSVKATRARARCSRPPTADEGVAASARAARRRSSTAARAGARDDPPRHRARRTEGRDVPAAARGRGAVSRGAATRLRRAGLSRRRRRRPRRSHRVVGGHARPPAADPAGQGRVLGHRDDHGRGPQGWTSPVLPNKDATDASTTRRARRLLVGQRRRGAPGVRQPQRAQHRVRVVRGDAPRPARRRGRGAGAVTAWPNPLHGAVKRSRRPHPRSTCRSASWCRAWRTSCAACSRTRPTSRSCAIATPRAGSSTTLVAPTATRRALGSGPPHPNAGRRPTPTSPGRFVNEPPAELRRERRPQTSSARRSTRVERELGFPRAAAHRRRARRHARRIVSVDPGRTDVDGLPQRVGRPSSTSTLRSRRAVPPGRVARAPRGASAPGCCSGPRDLMRRRRDELAALMRARSGQAAGRSRRRRVRGDRLLRVLRPRRARARRRAPPSAQPPGEANAYRYQPRASASSSRRGTSRSRSRPAW